MPDEPNETSQESAKVSDKDKATLVIDQDERYQNALKAVAADLPEDDRDGVRDGLTMYWQDILERSGQPVTQPREVLQHINKKLEEIDAKLTAQVNEIIHHKSFQTLEASWRGLQSLVLNSELQANRLEINVLNASKDDLIEHFSEYKGNSLLESPLYEKLYSKNLGSLGGKPIGCMVGDYYWSHKTEDVQALEGMSKIAATCHAPFVSSTMPEVFGVPGWSKLAEKTDQMLWDYVQSSPAHNKWNSLRKTDDIQYVALTLFRVMGREPYDKAKMFTYSEETEGKSENYVWVNSAFLMAENIAAAFAKNDWAVQWRGIEGGGKLERLPQHVLEFGDSNDTAGPVELSITNERDAVLTRLGFIPIINIQNSSDAVFISAQSLQQPSTYFGPSGVQATENAELHARLPYTFAAGRILHFITRMAQAKIGTNMAASQLQLFLKNWINQYVEENKNAPEETKRKKPLQAAVISVVPVEGKPGYYDVSVKVTPHIQFEGADVTLSMTSRVTKGK